MCDIIIGAVFALVVALLPAAPAARDGSSVAALMGAELGDIPGVAQDANRSATKLLRACADVYAGAGDLQAEINDFLKRVAS